MEILIVVAVMVIVASLASPNMMGMLESQRLRKSADLIRAEFAQARIKSMKSGRVYMFRYQLDTGNYLTQPWIMSDDALEASEEATEEAQFVSTDMADTLPEGVLFVGSENAADSRALAVEAESGGDALGSDWSQPILFYPDGTSSNSKLMLKNKREQMLELTLRGLTGISSTGDIHKSGQEAQ